MNYPFKQYEVSYARHTMWNQYKVEKQVPTPHIDQHYQHNDAHCMYMPKQLRVCIYLHILRILSQLLVAPAALAEQAAFAQKTNVTAHNALTKHTLPRFVSSSAR